MALRLRHLTRAEAEGFYHVHRERPFFGSLCAFMSSGPCITMVLERDERRSRSCARSWAPPIRPRRRRARSARTSPRSIEANCIHGSDAPETARFEIGYFFPGIELA